MYLTKHSAAGATTTEMVFVDFADAGGQHRNPFEVWVSGIRVGSVEIK